MFQEIRVADPCAFASQEVEVGGAAYRSFKSWLLRSTREVRGGELLSRRSVFFPPRAFKAYSQELDPVFVVVLVKVRGSTQAGGGGCVKRSVRIPPSLLVRHFSVSAIHRLHRPAAP